MTIDPLRHVTRVLSWAVSIRVAFLIVSVAIAFFLGRDADPAVPAYFARAWLVLTLRIGVGLVAVAVFTYMVSDCVKLRSTQSATGILYFGSLCAYIGELASQHLTTECAWPL